MTGLLPEDVPFPVWISSREFPPEVQGRLKGAMLGSSFLARVETSPSFNLDEGTRRIECCLKTSFGALQKRDKFDV